MFLGIETNLCLNSLSGPVYGARMTMLDIADPTGFKHPVQAAYVARDGFDAVIVTVQKAIFFLCRAGDTEAAGLSRSGPWAVLIDLIIANMKIRRSAIVKRLRNLLDRCVRVIRKW